MPDLSAILPVERGHQFLVAALDGFLTQSIPSHRIEILLVTPAGVRVPLPARHRKLRIRKVTWPRRQSLSSAVNAGARAARGPVLVLLDPKWRPQPGLAEYCLAFHRRYPEAADVLTLRPFLDAAMTDDPLLWWLDEQRMSGLSAPSSGIHNWRALRFDALSVKRALLRAHPLPAGENDEWLIKAQWTERAPIRAFVEPVPIVTSSGRPDLVAIMLAEYRASHARLKAMRASSQTFAADHVDDRFQHPEKYILARADIEELIATIDVITRELAGRNPRFAVGAEAERFAILGKLYLVAVSHARSVAWQDAKAGKLLRAGDAQCLRLGALVSSKNLER